MLEYLPKVIQNPFYIHFVVSSRAIILSQILSVGVKSIRVKLYIQGVRKHSSATSKEAMEESLLHAEVLENRDNLEMTKITKGSATPCVSLRLDASPRNVVESGCRQRQIYGDNGTFLRKLSATTILSTGMFLAYRASLKECLRF